MADTSLHDQIYVKGADSNLISFGNKYVFSKTDNFPSIFGYYTDTDADKLARPIMCALGNNSVTLNATNGTASITVKSDETTYDDDFGRPWYIAYVSNKKYSPSSRMAVSSGNHTYYIRNATTKLTSANSLVNTYLSTVSTLNINSQGYGTVANTNDVYDGIENYVATGKTVELTATPSYSSWFLSHWLVNDTRVEPTGNTYSFELTEDTNVVGVFVNSIEIDISHATIPSCNATVTWTDATTCQLSVSSWTSNYRFVGWYRNNVWLSSNTTYSYTPTQSETIEARFEALYSVTTSVVGGGAIDYTRQSSNENIVTFTVIPNARNTFTKYVINGVEYTETPCTVTLTQNTEAVAHFVEDPKGEIQVSTNIENGFVYISHNNDYVPYQSTIWARPYAGYSFTGWSDGSTENPRVLNVTENITLKATYQKTVETNAIYQYRCFIKDQLQMVGPPKVFLTVDTFSLKRDIMTKATSSFTFLDKVPSDINEGDVLVLYDPTGQYLYNGVITSIGDKEIRTSQMTSFYKGTWIYHNFPSSYLEREVASLLLEYSQGKIYKSTWTDPLVAQRLGGITIRCVDGISAKLPTDLDEEGNEQLTQMDMEDFIYELFEKYNIIFDFEINFSGENFVTIKVPDYTKMKVGNNMFAIQDMSPITTVEETNRLIVFAQDKTYRKTFIATKNGVVVEPYDTANRFNVTNTTIVFSDDLDADLVANNLPTVMYNHRLSFTLMIRNFIYEFGNFNLGGGLDIYNNDDYYDSILTGYEISKQSNRNITEVYFVCGKVRQKLTQLLTLRKI